MQMIEPYYEIVSNAKTVWVNGLRGCLGRFSKDGIDIHRCDLEAEVGECLDCTHDVPTRAGWQRFVDGMRDYHDVVVPQAHMPDWLKE